MLFARDIPLFLWADAVNCAKTKLDKDIRKNIAKIQIEDVEEESR